MMFDYNNSHIQRLMESDFCVADYDDTKKCVRSVDCEECIKEWVKEVYKECEEQEGADEHD